MRNLKNVSLSTLPDLVFLLVLAILVRWCAGP
jgi:hypothetical protein